MRAVDPLPGRQKRHHRQGDRTPGEGRQRSGEHRHATRECKQVKEVDIDN